MQKEEPKSKKRKVKIEKYTKNVGWRTNSLVGNSVLFGFEKVKKGIVYKTVERKPLEEEGEKNVFTKVGL
jgi:hypothetical protein